MGLQRLPIVSIHAPHARGDCLACADAYEPSWFQSTPLMRGATDSLAGMSSRITVSIHAPHARGDLLSFSLLSNPFRFNPRPSCEGRLPRYGTCVQPSGFQSTPLMRGATCPPSRERTADASFNPRPSCEGRPDAAHEVGKLLLVSIHAPHARGDLAHRDVGLVVAVSIHAPHARGDTAWWASSTTTHCFNPRPSCEGRRDYGFPCPQHLVFQSTPLMRGATARCCETLNITYPI